MNAALTAHIVSQVPGYADLQQAMHDALLMQNPEWIGDDGNCPKCDDYDRRLAELLSFSVRTGPTH